MRGSGRLRDIDCMLSWHNVNKEGKRREREREEERVRERERDTHTHRGRQRQTLIHTSTQKGCKERERGGESASRGATTEESSLNP